MRNNFQYNKNVCVQQLNFTVRIRNNAPLGKLPITMGNSHKKEDNSKSTAILSGLL